MSREIKNAKISGTMLGVEDHGILTAMIYLDYGGAGQGFGGYAFDQFSQRTQKRQGGAYGMEFIRQILEVLETKKWEDLKGTIVIAEADHGKVYRIGHILKDQWFDPELLKGDF